MLPQRPPTVRMAVDATWLVTLRWVAVIGQLLTVAVVAWVYRVPIRLAPLLAIIGLTAATNLVFAIWLVRATRSRGKRMSRRRMPGLVGSVMALDLASLTALLYLSGGPSNPFTVFFFVNLVLAAVVLPPRWAWTLTGFALVSFAALGWWHEPLPVLESDSSSTASWQLGHLRSQGALVAFLACSTVIVYFVTRVKGELQRREAELWRAQQQQARDERLASLATLAAGAAHELASPLSTIAVVAKELTRLLEDADVAAAVTDDVTLIRSEVDCCRDILQQMAAGAGQAVGDRVAPLRADELVDDVLSSLRRKHRVRMNWSPGAADSSVTAPRVSLAQAVRGVVQNALDATDPDGEVHLSLSCDTDCLHLEVRDQGPGMSEDILARVSEPFFTTKEPGQGMGLGLFLTRSVVESLGGSLELKSNKGQGTVATIRLPIVD